MLSDLVDDDYIISDNNMSHIDQNIEQKVQYGVTDVNNSSNEINDNIN